MKLYFSPGACSRVANIILHETQTPIDLVKVDLRSHKVVATGEDFYAINPKGYVPALQLDDGSLLTENIAVLEYLGDKTGMLAKTGDMKRYRTLEWVVFISTEIHKTFGPLFNPALPEPARAMFIEKLQARFKSMDEHLAAHEYLEEQFGLPDAYLFVVCGWTAMMKIDITGHTHLTAFLKRVAERASVKAAIAAEMQ
ncbi:MAG: glutathione transferase GstA [Pseudomonadales bacterium]|nr:glutathione transferase GstA [Pseudomonadales bacterium]